MKTRMELQSSDREINGKNVSVLSDNGYVCVTEAMEFLSDERSKNGLSPKKLNDIFKTQSFQERCIELINEMSGRGICRLKNISLQDFDVSLKSLNRIGLACRRGRGAGQKWFLEPYLFFSVALEMSPKLYAKVVMWARDGLLEIRNEAGNVYMEMSSRLYSIIDDKENFKDYVSSVAKGINFVVFNEHKDGRRNRASKEELNKIVEIERKIAYGIELGAFKCFDDVIIELRRMWKNKWGNPIKRLM